MTLQTEELVVRLKRDCHLVPNTSYLDIGEKITGTFLAELVVRHIWLGMLMMPHIMLWL